MKDKIKSITIANDEPYLRQVSSLVDLSYQDEIRNDIKVLEEFCLEHEVMAMAAV